MGKFKRVRIMIFLFVFVTLAVIYCVSPLRAEIAKYSASHYIERNYAQYDFETCDLTGTGYHSYYNLKWTTDYTFQSVLEPYLAIVVIHAWLPWSIQEAYLCEDVDGDYILLDR